MQGAGPSHSGHLVEFSNPDTVLNPLNRRYASKNPRINGTINGLTLERRIRPTLLVVKKNYGLQPIQAGGGHPHSSGILGSKTVARRVHTIFVYPRQEKLSFRTLSGSTKQPKS